MAGMQDIVKINEKINSLHRGGASPGEIAKFILQDQKVFSIWEESQVGDFNWDPRNDGVIIPVPYAKECYYPWGCNMLLSQIAESPQYALRYPESVGQTADDGTTDEYGNILGDNKVILALPSWLLDLDYFFTEMIAAAMETENPEEAEEAVKIIASYGELVPDWVLDELDIFMIHVDSYLNYYANIYPGRELTREERATVSDYNKMKKTGTDAIKQIKQWKKERKRTA